MTRLLNNSNNKTLFFKKKEIPLKTLICLKQIDKRYSMI